MQSHPTAPLDQVSKTLLPFGANYKITLSGAPVALELAINQLENYGVASSVPEDYRRGIDENVTINSNPKRFVEGINAIAYNETFYGLLDGLKPCIFNPVFRELKDERARELRDSFERDEERVPWENASLQTYNECVGFGARDGGSEE